MYDSYNVTQPCAKDLPHWSDQSSVTLQEASSPDHARKHRLQTPPHEKAKYHRQSSQLHEAHLPIRSARVKSERPRNYHPDLLTPPWHRRDASTLPGRSFVRVQRCLAHLEDGEWGGSTSSPTSARCAHPCQRSGQSLSRNSTFYSQLLSSSAPPRSLCSVARKP